MNYFEPETLSERENYKLLIGSIIPRSIALVVTQATNGVLNVAPFSYFSIASSKPPMISLAVQRRLGEPKDTARNLIETQEAVIHVVTRSLVASANNTAASFAPSESEWQPEWTQADSKKIKVPGIAQASIRFETKLSHHLVLKQKEEATADFFLLEVVGYHIDEAVLEGTHILPEKLAPVSRLAGPTYAELGRLFSLERPE